MKLIAIILIFALMGTSAMDAAKDAASCTKALKKADCDQAKCQWVGIGLTGNAVCSPKLPAGGSTTGGSTTGDHPSTTTPTTGGMPSTGNAEAALEAKCNTVNMKPIVDSAAKEAACAKVTGCTYASVGIKACTVKDTKDYKNMVVCPSLGANCDENAACEKQTTKSCMGPSGLAAMKCMALMDIGSDGSKCAAPCVFVPMVKMCLDAKAAATYGGSSGSSGPTGLPGFPGSSGSSSPSGGSGSSGMSGMSGMMGGLSGLISGLGAAGAVIDAKITKMMADETAALAACLKHTNMMTRVVDETACTVDTNCEVTDEPMGRCTPKNGTTAPMDGLACMMLEAGGQAKCEANAKCRYTVPKVCLSKSAAVAMKCSMACPPNIYAGQGSQKDTCDAAKCTAAGATCVSYQPFKSVPLACMTQNQKTIGEAVVDKLGEAKIKVPTADPNINTICRYDIKPATTDYENCEKVCKGGLPCLKKENMLAMMHPGSGCSGYAACINIVAGAIGMPGTDGSGLTGPGLPSSPLNPFDGTGGFDIGGWTGASGASGSFDLGQTMDDMWNSAGGKDKMDKWMKETEKKMNDDLKKAIASSDASAIANLLDTTFTNIVPIKNSKAGQLGSLDDMLGNLTDAFKNIAGTMTDCAKMTGIAEKVGDLRKMHGGKAVDEKHAKAMADAMFTNTKCLGDLLGDMGKMGGLAEDMVGKLGVDQWKGMGAGTFKNLTEAFGNSTTFMPDATTGKALADKMKDVYGDFSNLDMDTAAKVGNLVGFIDPSDMMKMDPASIAGMGKKLNQLKKDQFTAIAGNLGELADTDFEGMMDNLKDDTFDPGAFAGVMDTFSADQLAAIKKKTVGLVGALGAATADSITKLGAGATTLFKTFSPADFKNLNAAALGGDNFAKAGKLAGLGKDSIKNLADKAEEALGLAGTWSPQTADKLGAAGFGLTKDTLDKCNADAFKALLKSANAADATLFAGSDLLVKAKDLYKNASAVTADVFDTLGAGLADVFSDAAAVADFPVDVVKAKMDKLRDAAWKPEQLDDVAKKCKAAIGDLAKASKADGEKVGALIGSFGADLANVGKDFLYGALKYGDKFMELPKEKLDALVENTKKLFPAKDITANFIKKAGKFNEKMLTDIKAISEDAIDGAVETLKKLELDATASADVMSKLVKKAKATAGKLDKDGCAKAGKFLASATDDVLAALDKADMAGVDSEAVDIMDPTKLKKAFTADKIKGLTAKARKYIKGATLAILGNDQVKSAICPDGGDTCPAAVVDTTFTFDPTKTNQKAILAALKAKFAEMKQVFKFVIHTFKTKAKESAAAKTRRILRGRKLLDAAATDSVTLRSKEASKVDADAVATTAKATTVAGATSTANAVAVTDVPATSTAGPAMQPTNNKPAKVSAGADAAPSAVLAAVVAVLAMIA